MKRAHLFLIALILLAVACSLGEVATSPPPESETPTLRAATPTAEPTTEAPTLPPLPITPSPAIPYSALQLPPAGHFYHGIYPGGRTGEEDDITLDDLRSYEQSVGKTAAWVYFSHNWFRGREFPAATAAWIRDAGSVPYVRLMLWSDAAQNHAEPEFTLDRIVNGDFDDDLRAWARGARDFGSPLIAEFGTEVNGEWFPWNGVWNGGGVADGYGDPSQPDGPEKFRDAYRRIVQIGHEEGADNITWAFHANNQDIPDEAWNRLEQYYPGDEWVDWIGVSVYGAGTPMEEEWLEFRDMMDEVYPRLAALSADKPIVILEFGVTSGNPLGDQAVWAENALTDLLAARWPRVIGFSWWNETWQNDDDPVHDTDMRVQDNPVLGEVFQRLVGADDRVLSRLIYSQTLPASPPAETPAAGWWLPAPYTTWQWQLTELPVDQSFDVDMYDIELFDNEASVVAALHAAGRKVVCYVSAGSWENWRPDAAQFPAEVIGKDYGGWEGEKWLDIRQIDLLAPIIRARFDQCKAKGFDGIEPDNIDGYTNDTGFPLTYDDQLAYNIWLANEAHARGLSIGLKNDADQVADLLPYFDWALTEDCFDQGWCEQMTPFIDAGKAVFAAEYTDTGMALDQFCPPAKVLNFSAILKNRGLDVYREACP